MSVEEFETIVIGGGQAGLAVGLLPEEARPAVRDPRRERADRRLLAHAHVELAPPVHACALRRPARLAVPGRRLVVPDGARDGRLPRGVRGTVRASRAHRDDRRPADEGRRPLPRRVRRAAVRGRPAWSSRPASTVSRRCPTSPPSSTPRIVQMHSSEYRDPSQLARRRRAARRRRQLRCGHRDGGSREPPDLALRKRQGPGSGPHREPAGTLRRRRCSGSSRHACSR